MKIYLDNSKTSPNGWKKITNVNEAIHHLKSGKVTEMSINHELEGNQTGYDLIMWILNESKNNPNFIAPKIIAHGNNLIGKHHIEKVIKKLNEAKVFKQLEEWEINMGRYLFPELEKFLKDPTHIDDIYRTFIPRVKKLFYALTKKINEKPESQKRELTEIIRHEGNKWNVYTHDGSKKLGEHDTEEEAQKQLQAIEISKHEHDS